MTNLRPITFDLQPAPPDWVDRFDGLSALSPDLRSQLLRESRLVALKKGATVFGAGRQPEYLLLLIDGTVRVQQNSDSGRTIVLYRVDSGQSCVLTNACLLAHEDMAAEGIAETDVQAVAIPKGLFDRLVSSSQEFRSFVFTAYAQRMSDLFRVIDDVAFGRIDVRLAERLLALTGSGDTLRVTHQDLATELGTAREVVSRQLHDFQRRGWIAQSRGHIELIDRVPLETLAAS